MEKVEPPLSPAGKTQFLELAALFCYSIIEDAVCILECIATVPERYPCPEHGKWLQEVSACFPVIEFACVSKAVLKQRISNGVDFRLDAK